MKRVWIVCYDYSNNEKLIEYKYEYNAIEELVEELDRMERYYQLIHGIGNAGCKVA